MYYNWKEQSLEEIINNSDKTESFCFETKADYINFLTDCQNLGMRWISGENPLTHINYWEEDKGNIICHVTPHFEIYRSASDDVVEKVFGKEKTFTKSELKSGDILVHESGDWEIVVKELNGMICFVESDVDGYRTTTELDGWNSLDDINENFDATDDYDPIDYIYRTDNVTDALYGYNRDGMTCLWKRKKPRKMTLAQICKLLGEEIEIIEEK